MCCRTWWTMGIPNWSEDRNYWTSNECFVYCRLCLLLLSETHNVLKEREVNNHTWQQPLFLTQKGEGFSSFSPQKLKLLTAGGCRFTAEVLILHVHVSVCSSLLAPQRATDLSRRSCSILMCISSLRRNLTEPPSLTIVCNIAHHMQLRNSFFNIWKWMVTTLIHVRD